jgi:hypothetical protein
VGWVTDPVPSFRGRIRYPACATNPETAGFASTRSVNQARAGRIYWEGVMSELTIGLRPECLSKKPGFSS